MSDAPGQVIVDPVLVEGADATTLLDSQLSQSIGGLEVGAACWSLLLEPEGTFGYWVRVARSASDRWLVLGASGSAQAIADRLGRFKLREKATIAVVSAWVSVRSSGADGHGIALPSLWAAVGQVEEIVEGGAPSPAGSGAAALERRRVELGRISPDDVRPGDNPFAIGSELLAGSVSFTKGCYTGQELVARMDSRAAAAPRRLVVAECGAPPEVGMALLREGKEVGEVRTAPGGRSAICLLARAVDTVASNVLTEQGEVVVLREPTRSS